MVEIGWVRGREDVAQGVRGIARGEGRIARLCGARGGLGVDGWVGGVEGVWEGLGGVEGVARGVREGLGGVEGVRAVAEAGGGEGGGGRGDRRGGRVIITMHGLLPIVKGKTIARRGDGGGEVREGEGGLGPGDAPSLEGMGECGCVRAAVAERTMGGGEVDGRGGVEGAEVREREGCGGCGSEPAHLRRTTKIGWSHKRKLGKCLK